MIAVLQARLGSTRLPGKAFFTFFGQNMVERSIAIARDIRGVDEVVLATGDNPLNAALEASAIAAGARFFIGSEDNVLDRFCKAIEHYKGEYLLRMTCDNYLIQPEVIETLYQEALTNNADYAYIEPLSHFSGEIVRCDALRKCQQTSPTAKAIEHVTWDIRNRADYKRVIMPDDTCGLDHRQKITLDTLEDLIKMKELEHEHVTFRNLRCIKEIQKLSRDPC